jgi:hypothetical protein
MKVFLTLIFLSISLCLFSQIKPVGIDLKPLPESFESKKNENNLVEKKQVNDFWKNWIKKYVSENEFEDLETSEDSLTFRISSLTKAVTISTNDYKIFRGTVTQYIGCKNNIFTTQSINIDDETSKKIYEIFKQNLVFDIQSDIEINGWLKGFDGREILIEKKDTLGYSLKHYWTPEIFPQIREAKIINDIDKEIFDLVSEYKFQENLLSQDCEFAYNGVKGMKIIHRKATKKKKASH